MVALGRALMSRPRLLLLDEPSLGLAPLMVEEVLEAVTKEHLEILSALGEHDPDRVEGLVTLHLTNAEERTRRALVGGGETA